MIPLSPESLRRACDPSSLGFDTTAEVEPLDEVVGQPRAVAALTLALDRERLSRHVFVTGPPGTGRRSVAEAFLRRAAAARPTPPDVVYVHDFAAPERPRALVLPPGRGAELRESAAELVREACRQLSEAFESDSYRERHQRLHDAMDRRRQDVLAELERHAADRDVTLELTPVGVVMLPVVDGRTVPPQEVERLPPERLEAHRAAVEALQEDVSAAFGRIRAIEREATEAHSRLDREVATFAIAHLTEELDERWADVPAVVDWLGGVHEDLLVTVPRVRAEPNAQALPPGALRAAPGRLNGELARYEVNVVVSRDPAAGAPVEVSTNPTYNELFGCIEYETGFGVAKTDHRHVRAGAIHRASGGYLLLDAGEALARPFVWTRLKELLRTGSGRIENAGREMLLFPTASLEPEAIAVDVTVVLVGTPILYAMLLSLDADAAKLFRIRADFDVEMPRDADGEHAYAAFVSRRAGEADLPPFDATAVARLIDHGARVAGRRDRLSTRLGDLADVADEAAHRAAEDGPGPVRGEHVEDALRARRQRSDLVETRLLERMRDGTLRVELSGAAIGQVNGLAVAELGDHRFGHPVRITATVASGRGEVVDIDREAELSGPIHTKGVLILAGFLRDRYARESPLGLHASLVFEQSYGSVEGDSASGAELLALVSALARVPLRQDIAVTGSVDQHGAIQAVGGINEKVEGYFAACRDSGLTGTQGVVIPAANVADLMLEADVVEAVAAGRFSVWAAATVDEALELMTGVEAGLADADGAYAEESVNGRAQRRARDLGEAATAHAMRMT